MGYTTPRTWVAAETVDEDHMNEQVRDNMVFVHDALDDCVQRDGSTVAYASPSGTRAKNTVYQNTSGKTRFVSIYVQGGAASDEMVVYVEDATPPTIGVGGFIAVGATGAGTVSFVVPKNYYYKANEENATITLGIWVEWDIL